MTPDSNAHHGWGLPKGPQGRFPRDQPDPALHGPPRAPRATEAVEERQDFSQLDDSTSIAARIEPELHAVVDQALERVAALEVAAIQEARDQAQERERQAFEKLLDWLAQHSDDLDRLADSVSGIAGSMRQELEELDTVVAELTGAPPALDGDAPEGEAAVEDLEELDPPEPELEPLYDEVSKAVEHESSAPAAESMPEITGMFRHSLENMWRSGTSREEAERWLMRFELGEHHRYLLDEIYSNTRIVAQPRKGFVGWLRGN